jgi:hypothetical protein
MRRDKNVRDLRSQYPRLIVEKSACRTKIGSNPVLAILRRNLGNFIATGIVSLLLVMTAFFGARITIHHREVEIDKLSNIKEIETKLGAEQMGLVGIGKERIPSPIIWYKVFHRKPSTLMFILVTHYMVIFFGITYLFFSDLNHFLHLI